MSPAPVMLVTVMFGDNASVATIASRSSFGPLVETFETVIELLEDPLSANAVWSLARTPVPPAGDTVKVTSTVVGDPCAPAAVIVMWPVYVPAANPFTAADIWTDWGAVPDVGEAVSQLLSLDAVKLNEPTPELVMFTEAGAGFVPPAVALNVTVVGETARIGVVAGNVNAPTIPPPLKLLHEPAKSLPPATMGAAKVAAAL